MPAPCGYTYRHDTGPRGWLARWWLRRRIGRIERKWRG